MSKDNRDMSIEENFPMSIRAWKKSEEYKKFHADGFIITGGEEIFYDFQVSQYAYWYSKKLQEKLDAAIEVIKKLADHCFEEPDTYFACVFCDMGNSGHSLKGKGYHDDYCLAKRARDFLKARGE